jgi:hypothetical protein
MQDRTGDVLLGGQQFGCASATSPESRRGSAGEAGNDNQLRRDRPELRDLPLRRRRIRGTRRLRRLGLNWLRFHTLQHRGRTTAPGCIKRQCDGSDHKGHGRPRRRPRKRAGRAPRTKSCLAALPAKRRGNIPALAALQQNDHDDKKTNQNVNSSDQINHKF